MSMGYKRILVPVDGSTVSDRGLKEAARLARDNGGRLRLLHVVEEYAALSNPSDAGAAIGPILDALRDAGQKKLTKIERRARTLRVRSDSALVENLGGRVADAIVDQAKR